MKKCLYISVASLIMVFSLSVHAGGVLNVGLDYLQMTSKLSNSQYNGEANPTALQLRVSTGLIPFFDIEGVIALGATDDEFPNSGGSTAKLTTLTGVYALTGFDAIPFLNIYGKAGFVRYEIEGEDGDKVDESGFAYGFGVALDLPALGTIIVEQNFYPNIEPTGTKIETTATSIGYHVGF